MDEPDLRELFQQAPGDAPPPSFGLEDVTAASRRATARQRMRIAAASSAAVLVLAGGGIFAAFGPLSGGGNSGNVTNDVAAAAPEMHTRGEEQSSAAQERQPDGGFPLGRVSPKQGGETHAEPGGDATRTERCIAVDRELATALAGELPVDPQSGPIPGELACPSGVSQAAFVVRDGPRRGVITIARVPARMAQSGLVINELNETGLPAASAKAADGSTIVVAIRGEGGAGPYESQLLRIAERVAAGR